MGGLWRGFFRGMLGPGGQDHGGGIGSGAAGGPDTYYYSYSGPGATTDYENANTATTGIVTCAQGGTITSYGAYLLYPEGEAYHAKLALYSADGTTLLHTGTEHHHTAGASTYEWIEETGLNIACGTGVSVRVADNNDCSSYYHYYQAATSTGSHVGVTYSSFPEATINISTTILNPYIRIYVD